MDSQDPLKEKIRLLIVDDHDIVREGLRAFIATQERIVVLGEAADGQQAVEMARTLKPDVILMDILMPEMNGIEATRLILAENPDIHILILTSYAEDDMVHQAIKAGAMGYLLKDSSSKELLRAIEDINRGVASLHPKIVDKLVKDLRKAPESPKADLLTEKEKKVLTFVAKGYSNKEIAAELSLSDWTVRTHLRNIFNKLNLANRTQAALYALHQGLDK